MKFVLILIAVLCFTVSYSQDKKPEVKEFKFTDCKSDCKIGVISKKGKGKKMTLVTGVNAQCCMKFECDVKMSGDTMIVKSLMFGSPCRCYCNYELSYVIGNIKCKKIKEIKLEHDWHPDWDTPEERKAKLEK
ncbi:MAG: hypothetical protein A2W91_04375 [Bacteroidetes bacterium GWF2_38_335]|nr:MAG: hypothetical protein A2W91_04375 [Bacteroidetes bacterium GWF2_38_335]HBS88257.1 hypothetical protein [Bacteroidales bacterium]